MVLTKTPSKYATSKIIITDYLLRKNTNYNIHYAGEKSVFPVDTRRRFNIDTTSCNAVRRRTDVRTTSFVYWVIGYWFKSVYVKEVISPIQNFVIKPKRPLKIKKHFFGSLPAASGPTGVTEIKWKESELPFHPNFSYNAFTYL